MLFELSTSFGSFSRRDVVGLRSDESRGDARYTESVLGMSGGLYRLCGAIFAASPKHFFIYPYL